MRPSTADRVLGRDHGRRARRHRTACADSRRISFEAFFGGGGGKDVGRLSVSALPTGQEDIAPSSSPHSTEVPLPSPRTQLTERE